MFASLWIGYNDDVGKSKEKRDEMIMRFFKTLIDGREAFVLAQLDGNFLAVFADPLPPPVVIAAADMRDRMDMTAYKRLD